MLIAQDIEKKILTAFAAVIPDVPMDGSWQVTNSGIVKNTEGAELMKLSVATSSPAFATFTGPIADINVELAFVVRADVDITAQQVATNFAPIEKLLTKWQFHAADMSAALSTSNFSADGFRLDSGLPPECDTTRVRWLLSRSFTIRGVITEDA